MARPVAPLDASSEKMHRRQLAETVNRIMAGQINVTLKVTLKSSATTTTVTDSRISIDTVAIPAPSTAHAAAEIGNGTMYWTCSNGTLTITHANSTQTDRTFNFVLLG